MNDSTYRQVDRLPYKYCNLISIGRVFALAAAVLISSSLSPQLVAEESPPLVINDIAPYVVTASRTAERTLDTP